MTGPARDRRAVRPRLQAIDAVRGGVMVVMALDHVRDFIHHGAQVGSPTDLATTTPILFMTRWVTHFCAPAFVALAGVAAYLWWRRGGGSRSDLSRFLLLRGLLLVALELTVMRVAYTFDLSLRDPILLLVLWVLGACMVVLSALVWLPPRWLAAASIVTLLLHDLVDGVQASRFGSAAAGWYLLHQVGAFRVGSLVVIVGYPLVPWVALMAAGFCAGPLFDRPTGERQRVLGWAGGALILAFLVLRWVNGYGDPAPWQAQASGTFTVLSFLNTTKYPPSLAFSLMTLGPLLLALAAFEAGVPRALRFLVVFGRVPLFFFVTHFYAAHVAAAGLALLAYGDAAWSFLFHPLPSMGGPAHLFPDDFGYNLWIAYAVWVLIVAALYPACRRMAALKAEGRHPWFSYF